MAEHEETRKEIEKSEGDVADEQIVADEVEQVIYGDGQWLPKTVLGHDVLRGKYSSLEDIISKGLVILEPQIVDIFLPDIKAEVILIGGTPGKGGGIRRTVTKRTARMHKSGRRFKLTALLFVGNENGLIGIGKATSQEHRIAIEKATEKAKLNIINVRKGCGSWECKCGEGHSIPFKTSAKHGSVRVELIPGPKGLGIVADKTSKSILRLAGITDVWVKTFGNTVARNNLAFAIFEALRKMNSVKGDVLPEPEVVKEKISKEPELVNKPKKGLKKKLVKPKKE